MALNNQCDLQTGFIPGLKHVFKKTIDPEDPKCTCKEDSKQRAICPVCDKEEFELMKQLHKNAIKSR